VGDDSSNLTDALEDRKGFQATRPWPVLDRAARHGLAGEFLALIEPQSEADPVALLLQFLIAVGSAVGPSAYFAVEGAQHRANLFGLLVGQTSKARKGTSWAHVTAVMEQADQNWASARIRSGLSTGEGLIWEVRDPIHKQESVRDKGRIVGYEDIVVDPGVENKRLLVVESEFARILRVMGRDGNVLSEVLRQAWDLSNLRVMTKTSPASATGAHISIVAHVTQEELRRELDHVDVANGFLNRFLIACVKRSKLLPEGGNVDRQALVNLGRRVAHVVETASVLGELRRDDACRERWYEVYPWLSEPTGGLAGAVVSRAEAQVTRLALLFAVLDQSSVIQVEHLNAGLAIWAYCEASARYLFGDSTGNALADRIERILREAHPDGMVKDQLHGALGRHVRGDKLDHGLQLLAGLGRAYCRREPTGGRPREEWFWAPSHLAPWVQQATETWHAYFGPAMTDGQISSVLRPMMDDPETDPEIAREAVKWYCEFRPYRDYHGTFANWGPGDTRAPNMAGVTPHDLAASWPFWYGIAAEVRTRQRHPLYNRPELFRRA
jgi:hypothetical protein